MTLTNQIQNFIQQHGAITFADFMQRALYTPNFGYYSSGSTKFGPNGDFITAPELTNLFGYTLANEFKPILENLSQPNLLEFGAGSGKLCIDVLTRLEQLDSLPEQYLILELSADLKARQKHNILQQIPHLAHKVTWLDSYPQTPFAGIILANEVLDAMPVARFAKIHNQLFESYINCHQSGELYEEFLPIKTPGLGEYITQALPNLENDYQSEVNLWLPGWFKSCASILTHGAMFIIDYGFPRHEFYHADRNRGTLMCHYQHTAHANPLINIGLQDLTAHVDFTHVAESAHAAGLHVAGYTNQASFLLANGLLNLLSLDNNIMQQQAVKQLIQPSEMGELFKVIALTKQLEIPLTGFQLSDKRARL
jgi:SAM-dependent MidA family methyltransferase